jgi:type II secretory pathway predicted ATPase ExeA
MSRLGSPARRRGAAQADRIVTLLTLRLASGLAVKLLDDAGRTAAEWLPRAINNLGLQALVATYAANKTIVDTSAARAAVAEVTAE